jgi:hypothetical protein
VAHISIIFGLLLIALGVGGFVGTGSSHYTALIPLWFGLALLLLGLLALKPNLRKHAMHLAAVVGVAGVAGATWRLLLPLREGTEFHLTVSVGCVVAMAVLCLLFVALCVNSFIQARRQRRAAG